MSNPHSQDTSYWDAALEHYQWDRLEQAFDQIADWGIGEAGAYLRWYRVIEAETTTRRKSEVRHVNEWLELEIVPEEVRELESELAASALKACDKVAARLGWSHTEPTRIAILASETEAPWATHPYGYCALKEPYAKICLPGYLIDDLDEFTQAVAHEYAHVVSAGLADDYAPRWIEEAISVLVEQEFDEASWRGFRNGSLPWLSPSDLELALIGRSDDDGDKEEVWLAYQQAGWIGRYLASLGEERQLGDLLRSIADESPVRNLARIARRQGREDAALRQVYGLNVRQLFERTLAYVRSSGTGFAAAESVNAERSGNEPS